MVIKVGSAFEDKEYIRGISAWNFNLEDLKTQAALIESSDDIVHSEDADNNHKLKDGFAGVDFSREVLSSEGVNHSSTPTSRELYGIFGEGIALKNGVCFDVCEDDTSATSADWKGQSNSESILPFQQSLLAEDVKFRKWNGENMERTSSVRTNIDILGHQKFSSGSLLPVHVLSPYRNNTGESDREIRWLSTKRCNLEASREKVRYLVDIVLALRICYGNMANVKSGGGDCMFRFDWAPQRDALSHEESLERKVVQHKGRFKVTSADAGPKVASPANCMINPVGGEPKKSTVNAASLIQMLRFLLQQNAMQKVASPANCMINPVGGEPRKSTVNAASLIQMLQFLLQQNAMQKLTESCLKISIGKLSEEVQRLKLKNVQRESDWQAPVEHLHEPCAHHSGTTS
ncbi:putative serine/threonine-protein kinase BLUS1 [Cocos nucifera]|nr:putative serine/threonine-protein kinase BLUS1 [Cocos nucifera]